MHASPPVPRFSVAGPVSSPRLLHRWRLAPAAAAPSSRGDNTGVTGDECDGKVHRKANESVGTFSRLKAQKVKSLIKRSSTISKEGKGSLADEALQTELERHDSMGNIEQSEIRSSKDSFGIFVHKVSDAHQTRNAKSRSENSYFSDSEEALEDTHQHNLQAKVAAHSNGWGAVSDTTYGSSNRQRRTTPDDGFYSSRSFKEVGCSDDLITALKKLSFLRPSHIQAVAYGPILDGKSCIMADQSGSGKTLAYLCPIIQSLRHEELSGLGKSLPRSPRVLVLAPTAELASQVLHNCRSISKNGVPFRSMVATGGFRQKTQLESLGENVDVLIATPGRFSYLVQEGFLQLASLKCVVLDEVDILFGEEGFEQVLQSLISVAPVSAQYLFVTATLPLEIYNKVVEVFPDCEVIMGPRVHRTSSRLEEILVDCSGDNAEDKSPETAFASKKTALLRILEDSPVPKTIVFCNKIETCRRVENVLKRVDRRASRIKVLPFHAALSQELRLANIKEFLTLQSTESMFLICTDRASRGIDFRNVDHVILFDFPRDPSEYVRRVGRTARGASGSGKSYAFVVGKQVSLARRIMERNKKGHPLHEVPAGY